MRLNEFLNAVGGTENQIRNYTKIEALEAVKQNAGAEPSAGPWVPLPDDVAPGVSVPAPAVNQNPIRQMGFCKRETIDRVRNLRAPFGNPAQPYIHRVRNEATERDLSQTPWCGVPYIDGETRITILDTDVTCPVCIEIIGRHQAERRGEVDICSVTHFSTTEEGALCGLKWDGDKVKGLRLAVTLRETTCPACLDKAEELLVDVIRDPDPTERMFLKLEKLAEEPGGALRDIAQTLKEVRNIMAAILQTSWDPHADAQAILNGIAGLSDLIHKKL